MRTHETKRSLPTPNSNPQPQAARPRRRRCALAAIATALLAGVLATPAAAQVLAGADGELFVFASGAAGEAYVRSRLPDGRWGPAKARGWGSDCAARNRDGRLEIFRGGQHCWEMSDGRWSPWDAIPDLPSNVVLAAAHPYWTRNLEAFFLTQDNKIYRALQASYQGEVTGWMTPSLFSDASPVAGRAIERMVAATNADLRSELFCVVADQVWHTWQLEPGGGHWSEWSQLQTLPARATGQLRVATNEDGRLDVFVGTMAGVWHAWQHAAGGWVGWERLGNDLWPVDFVSTARHPDGHLEVFHVNRDGHRVRHVWQTAPNGAWSGAADFGVAPEGVVPWSLSVGQNADGRVEVFVKGASSGRLMHRYMASSGWSGWETLDDATEAVEQRVLSFRPTVHGWPFPNHFDIIDVLKGFCGGMTFCSADAFYQGEHISRGLALPADNTSLYDRLRDRQIDSVLHQAAKILQWNVHAGATRPEWSKVKAGIDRGELVPLMLIRTLPAAPWQSHQVLAYGYHWDRVRNHVIIRVYDPNRPNDDTSRVRFEFSSRSPNDVVPAHLESQIYGTSTYDAMYAQTYDRTGRPSPVGHGYGNTRDSRLLWLMDVNADGKDEVVRFNAEHQRFEIGHYTPEGTFCFRDAGSTSSFGDVGDGRPILHDDFTGPSGVPDGREDLVFYRPVDQTWILGVSNGANFSWRVISHTPGFGQFWPGVGLWTGNVDGDARPDVVFYQPGDGHWWFGRFDGVSLNWNRASESGSFGNLLDGRPIFVRDFTGDGRTDVLFYYAPHGTFWLGVSDGTGLHWQSHVAPVSAPTAASPLLAGDFAGTGSAQVMFRDPIGRGWTLAQFGSTVSWSAVGFGPSSDEPSGRRVVGDFDGDGRDEVAITATSDARTWIGGLDGSLRLDWTWSDNRLGWNGWYGDARVEDEDLFYLGVGRIDGDGSDDVLTTRFTVPTGSDRMFVRLGGSGLTPWRAVTLGCPGFGRIAIFGRGCLGSNGAPSLGVRGEPSLGSMLDYEVRGAAPGTLAWVAFGGSNRWFLGIPLPFDNAPIGAPGCLTYCDQLVHVAVPCDANGEARLRIRLPDDRGTIGGTWYAQALVFDRAANLLGLTSSNGVEVLIGPSQ